MNPGSTSPADMSRTGFETILESKGDDTDVSIRVGVKFGAFLVDGTLKSDVDKADSVTKVIAADREPLSSAGSFTVGLTHTSGLSFESDGNGMLAVCGDRTPCATNNKDLPDDVREKLRSMIKFNAARAFGMRVRKRLELGRRRIDLLQTFGRCSHRVRMCRDRV